MSECIFCSIVAGEIPAEIVYEDEHFLAFMDINPAAPGHVQVVPKAHHTFVWDVPALGDGAPDIGEYFNVVRHLARTLQGMFGTEYIFSKVMGDEVPHAHVWLFPNPNEARGDASDLAGNAEKIRRALS